MTNHEKTRIDEIVSYTPPQLYTGKEWYIGFMAFDPALGKLHRKRIKIMEGYAQNENTLKIFLRD